MKLKKSMVIYSIILLNKYKYKYKYKYIYKYIYGSKF